MNQSDGTDIGNRTDQQTRARAWRARRTGIVGCLGIALAAASAIAQSTLPLHSEWNPPQHETFLFTEDDEDTPVDIVTFVDGSDTFVYIAGTVTTDVSGRIFALQRYNADDPTQDVTTPVYFPVNALLTETRHHVAAAMAVDAETGDIYVAGLTTKSNGETDYRIVKWNKNLTLQTSWGGDGAVDWDGTFGDDKAVDIAVHGTGTAKRVFVTGVSYGGSTHLNDIVTLALFPDDGDVDWEDRYQGPTAGVQIATELVIVGTAGQEGGGYAPVVGGSTWTTSNGFDIAAIGYWVAASTPQRRWVRTLDGPAHDHDFCTGVGALPEVDLGTAQPVALCGMTMSDPPYPNDWNYVTIALDSADGSDWWNTAGVIWEPPGSEDGSSDIPADICIRTTNPLQAWVTGSAEVDMKQHVATIAYSLEANTDPDEIFASTFTPSASNSADNFPVAIKQGTSGTTMAVTGWSETGSTLPIYLTLEYLVGDELEVNQMAGFSGDDLANKAMALWVHGEGIYVTGFSGSEDNGGVDWVTMRYDP